MGNENTRNLDDNGRKIIPESELEVLVLKYPHHLPLEQRAAEIEKNLKLLDRYYESYEKIFDIPDEVTPKETYQEILTSPEVDRVPLTTVSILVAGASNPETAEVLAFAHGEFYPESEFALRTYVGALKNDYVIEKEVLGQTRLVDIKSDEVVKSRDQQFVESAELVGKEVKGMVSEMNNPLLISAEEDVMNPWLRAAVTAKYLGGKALPFDYVQPALTEDGEPVPLVLNIYKSPDSRVEKQASYSDVAAFLKEFYRVLEVPDLENNTDYINSVNQLSELQNGAERPVNLSEEMNAYLEVLGSSRGIKAKLREEGVLIDGKINKLIPSEERTGWVHDAGEPPTTLPETVEVAMERLNRQMLETGRV